MDYCNVASNSNQDDRHEIDVVIQHCETVQIAKNLDRICLKYSYTSNRGPRLLINP